MMECLILLSSNNRFLMLEEESNITSEPQRKNFIVTTKSFIDHPVDKGDSLCRTQRRKFLTDSDGLVRVSLFWSSNLVSKIEKIIFPIKKKISRFAFLFRRLENIVTDIGSKTIEKHEENEE